MKEISFPVFKLRNKEPIREKTELFYITENEVEVEEGEGAIQVSTKFYIDDTGVPGNSLGRRRLLLKYAGLTLCSISTALPSLKDLVKSAVSKYWYIDSKGKLFQYRRTRKENLFCAKVLKILPVVEGSGCILEVEGIPTRFKLSYYPKDDEKYAGILTFYGGYLLYGMYTEPFRKTIRKV